MGILIAIEQQKWEKARNETKIYFQKADIQEPVDSVFNRHQPELKDPDRAGLLSTFLPGSGQFYAGRAGEGFTSFFFHISALGWGTYNVITGYFATALITGGGLFQSFYFGGIERAEHLAESHNSKTTYQANAELTSWLLSKLNGYLNQKRRSLSESPFHVDISE